VARRAADRGEDTPAVADGVVDRPTRNRREKLHERGEVIDVPQSRHRIRFVLGIGADIAGLHPIGVDAVGKLRRENVVGDAHLVPVRVPRKREQRRDLRLPAEPAHAALARGRIDDH
jgi:hypothetical protein